jgi:hypothetical protein
MLDYGKGKRCSSFCRSVADEGGKVCQRVHQAKLERAVEVHKKQLEETTKKHPEPGFKDLPAGIADILFGGTKEKSNGSAKAVRDPRKRGNGNGSGSSSSSAAASVDKTSMLGAMSEADLVSML